MENTVVGNGTTTNGTTDPLCIDQPVYKNSMIILFLIVVVASIIENFLLLTSYAMNSKLRSHAVSYVISLSASDLITALTIGWLEIYYIWDYPHWVFEETGSMAQNSFWCFSMVTPFMHIIVISIDRYRAVAYPNQYSQNKSWRNVFIKIVFIWCYSVSVVVLMAFHFTPATGSVYIWNVPTHWYYPFLAVHTIIPLIICSVLYYLILQNIIKHNKKSKTCRQELMQKEQRRYTRIIGLIILLLYVVWIPVIIVEVLYAKLAHTCVISQIGTISVWLTCTSGVINPLLFLSKNRNFRSTIVMNLNRLLPVTRTRKQSMLTLRVRAETVTSDCVNNRYCNEGSPYKPTSSC